MKKATDRVQKSKDIESPKVLAAPENRESRGGKVRGDGRDPERTGGPPPDAKQQAELFDQAIKTFHTRDFAKAKELFEAAASGPTREMAHSARLHVRMCEQRILKQAPQPITPEEHYNYAISLINERRLDAAEQHLRQAIERNPDGDHLHYALALCRGLGGDLNGAYQHLKRAIDLQPRNRVAARNDPDFAELGHQMPLSELLYPERVRPA